jgi:hypothetical protein
MIVLRKHHYFLLVSFLFLIFLLIKKNYLFHYLFLDHNFYDNLFGDFLCFQKMNNSVHSFFYDDIEVKICAYPRVWILISRILNFHSEFSLQVIIFLGIVVYIYIFYDYIKKNNSLFFFYFFFSGASLSLMHRGNIDIFILILLFFSFTSKKFFNLVFFFLLSIILKLYPVFAFPAFINRLNDLIKNQKCKIFKISIVLFFFILIYFILSINDIKKIMSNLPHMSGYASYGLKSITEVMFAHYNIVVNPYFIGILLLLISFIFFFLFEDLFHKKDYKFEKSYFLLGSLIYILNFLVFVNYDNRLILLIFVIPTFLKLSNKVLKYISLTSIVLSVELVRILIFVELFNIPRVYGGAINILGKLLLFAILFSMTLKILLKDFFSIKKILLKNY